MFLLLNITKICSLCHSPQVFKFHKTKSDLTCQRNKKGLLMALAKKLTGNKKPFFSYLRETLKEREKERILFKFFSLPLLLLSNHHENQFLSLWSDNSKPCTHSSNKYCLCTIKKQNKPSTTWTSCTNCLISDINTMKAKN